MNTISISQLKANPTAALSAANSFPVAIQNRNKTKGYLLSNKLFEKMITLLEDTEDRKTIETIDLSKKIDFEDFANTLGI